MATKHRWLRLLFVAMCTFIVWVSLYDAWLVVKYSNSILDHEQNPLCRYLIELNDGEVGIFLRVKAAGTLCVVSMLVGLFRYKQSWAIPTTGSITLFQSGLLAYLSVM